MACASVIPGGHFVNYSNLFLVFIGGELDTLFNRNMGNAKEGEWRDARSSFSPIFTSGRMKGMMKLIKQMGNSLTEEIGRKKKQERPLTSHSTTSIKKTFQTK